VVSSLAPRRQRRPRGNQATLVQDALQGLLLAVLFRFDAFSSASKAHSVLRSPLHRGKDSAQRGRGELFPAWGQKLLRSHLGRRDKSPRDYWREQRLAGTKEERGGYSLIRRTSGGEIWLDGSERAKQSAGWACPLGTWGERANGLLTGHRPLSIVMCVCGGDAVAKVPLKEAITERRHSSISQLACERWKRPLAGFLHNRHPPPAHRKKEKSASN